MTPDRDLVIDLARFFCLALVVVSHTMMVSPVLHAGRHRDLRQHPRQPALVRTGGLGPAGHAALLRCRGHDRPSVLAAPPRPGRQYFRLHAGADAAAPPPRRSPARHHVRRALGGAAGRRGPAGHPAAGFRGGHAAVVPRCLPRGAAEPPAPGTPARPGALADTGGAHVVGGGGGLPAGDDADAGIPQHGLRVVRCAAAWVLPGRRRPAGPWPCRAGGHYPGQQPGPGSARVAGPVLREHAGGPATRPT